MYECTYVCVMIGSGLLRGQDWESLFDVVIVGACKPAFLTDEFMSIFRVNRFNSYYRQVRI